MSANVRIGIIGDLDPGKPSHRATNEALKHCAGRLGITADVVWIPTESLEEGANKKLQGFNGIWCAPGSPYRSIIGALEGIRFARENDYPFLGTCGGFQHAVIEYAQNKLGYMDAHHAEYDPDASNLFITALSCSLVGQTMKILLAENSRIRTIYEESEITERYNCNFGLNPECQALLDQNGFKVAGTDEKGEARILEIPANSFYIATLFQPQLSSSPDNPHKLVMAYLDAAREF